MCNFGFQPEALNLNRAFLDIFEELLVLQIFFAILTPCTARTIFILSSLKSFFYHPLVFALQGVILQKKSVVWGAADGLMA